MGFYERLETLRKNAGIGQGKLEKELGIANGSIAKWKNRMPKFSTLVKIADYFNVTVDYLVNDDDNNTSCSSEPHEKSKQGMYIGKISTKGLHNLVYEIMEDSLNQSLSKTTPPSIHIRLIGEPEIQMDSKHAYDLIKLIADMPEEDLELLALIAKRITPAKKKKKNVIFVSNPNNKITPGSSIPRKPQIPFAQYPTVTDKDIDEFAAKNSKKKYSREEIAKLLFETKNTSVTLDGAPPIEQIKRELGQDNDDENDNNVG